MNDLRNQPHPEDLLDAYALDALEEAETLQVELHLEGCDRCRLAVAELHNAVSRLGQSVVQLQPPSALRLRVIPELEPAVVQTEAAVSRPIWRASKAPVVRFLLPTAAAVMVALFALGIVMNLGLSNRTEDLERENAKLTAQVALATEQDSQLADRTEDLEQENATLTAQVALSTEQDSQLADRTEDLERENKTLTTLVALSTEQDSRLAETVQQLRLTNYWLANPENQSMNLKPPSGVGSSRGILVVTSDGRRAMLLLAGMRERPLSSTYHVWLMRGESKVWAGKLQVDDEGWGTTTIQPSESVFRFDKIELTAEMVPGVNSSLTPLVLEGEIATPEPSRMYVLQQTPWQ